MTEGVLRNKDWSPDRKRKRSNDTDFIQEQMEIDGMVSWIGEDMIIDEEFVEMCFRRVEVMEVCESFFSLGRKSSRGCCCCRRNFKKYCRKKRNKKN